MATQAAPFRAAPVGTAALMFEHLARYPKIVVTGPQRSGTRIAARMIAADTGHRFVDECDFLIKDRSLFLRALDQDNVVVQAPHMLKDVVDGLPVEVFVVLMRRDLDQIHASEKRIRWAEDLLGNTTELRKFGLSEGDSAAVKYEYWDAHHKHVPFMEVDYESLRAHQMYVPAQLRKDFGPLQTSVGT